MAEAVQCMPSVLSDYYVGASITLLASHETKFHSLIPQSLIVNKMNLFR